MQVFIAVAVISILSTGVGVNAGPVQSCTLQKNCLSWTMTKLKTAVCGLAPCELKVCMNISTASPCAKAGGTIGHVCGKGSANDCVIVATWNKKKENVGNDSFCQVGKPGDYLTFIVKDGSDTTSDIDRTPPTSTGIKVCGTDVTVICQQVKAAGVTACAGGQNNLMERVWNFTIPGNACDTCNDGDGGISNNLCKNNTETIGKKDDAA
jgi:hypothetical protein